MPCRAHKILKKKKEKKLSNRDKFRGEVVEGGLQGLEDLGGGFVKNNQPKGRFDDEGKGGRPKTGGSPKYRKPEDLPPAERTNKEKENKMGNTTNTPRLNPADNNMVEPCPVCGNQKYREATFTEGGVKKTVKVLVCRACSDAHRKHQEEVKAANVKFLVANPTAPEPAGPKSKFDWVLSQIDLIKFEAEAESAQAAYRAQYDEVVVKVLSGRGYLVDTPEWKGTGTSRPVMRFTGAAFNGNGPALKQALEDGLKDLRWAMRRASGRLEAATRIKAELAPAPAPAPAADKPADDSTPPVDVKPPAKSRKKQQ